MMLQLLSEQRWSFRQSIFWSDSDFWWENSLPWQSHTLVSLYDVSGVCKVLLWWYANVNHLWNPSRLSFSKAARRNLERKAWVWGHADCRSIPSFPCSLGTRLAWANHKATLSMAQWIVQRDKVHWLFHATSYACSLLGWSSGESRLLWVCFPCETHREVCELLHTDYWSTLPQSEVCIAHTGRPQPH